MFCSNQKYSFQVQIASAEEVERDTEVSFNICHRKKIILLKRINGQLRLLSSSSPVRVAKSGKFQISYQVVLDFKLIWSLF